MHDQSAGKFGRSLRFPPTEYFPSRYLEGLEDSESGLICKGEKETRDCCTLYSIKWSIQLAPLMAQGFDSAHTICLN